LAKKQARHPPKTKRPTPRPSPAPTDSPIAPPEFLVEIGTPSESSLPLFAEPEPRFESLPKEGRPVSVLVACMYVCGEGGRIEGHVVYMHVHVYMCVCMCVCVCM
jgi:hypothetical protein